MIELILDALASGAEAAASGIAKTEMTKAWDAAKSFLHQRGHEWTNDRDQTKQAIEQLNCDDLQELLKLLRRLIHDLAPSENTPPTAAGVDLRQLHAKLLEIDVIDAGGGTALLVEKSHIDKIKIGTLTTGRGN